MEDLVERMERLARRRPELPTADSVDSVTAEIVRGAMETIAYEMSTHVARTAVSAMLNQSNEITSTILDANGRLAAAQIGIPQLLFIHALPVRFALEFFGDDLHDGDVLLCNDAYHGAGHLPDFMVIAPVFHQGELLFFTNVECHHGDTGGKDPGGFSADALDIWAEGLRIPMLKLVERGTLRKDVFYTLQVNNRLPGFGADLQAQIGAAQVGARRLKELVTRYGGGVIKAAVNLLIRQTEDRLQEEVRSWPNGRYEGEVIYDHDTMGHKDIRVHCLVTVGGDRLHIDYSGSDRRSEIGQWNTFGNTRSYMVAQLASMIDPTIPKNEGLFNAIEFVAPRGTVLNPEPNRPVALGAFHPAVEVGEALCVALSQIKPEKASPQVYKIGMPNVLFGFDARGNMWLDHGVDTRSADSGGVKGVDGWGANPACLGALIMQPTEELESRAPVRMVSRQYTIDTGGPGQWRGSPGTLNHKEVLAPCYAMAWMVSMRHTIRGINGGCDASPYSLRMRVGSPEEFKVECAAFNVPHQPGESMAYQFGGGSGWGDPLKRDPQAVLDDVLDEYVSVAGAARDYGVVLTGALTDLTLAVDEAASEKLRAELRAQRARATEGN